jgi:hypothetical protein
MPGIEPGTSESLARNSDHYMVYKNKIILGIKYKIQLIYLSNFYECLFFILGANQPPFPF